ncbi:hypothetical protein K432DRAFT_407572 [Lepidopterella palustris CBS 459.81]|uniref:Uncharacterized protein n=1 Tax=Lepidopterella palustris CBS 459.81 TaxID=1314670 RepID=A0A8E2E4B0_9PEZI|nr:hypothetical protein K432DRAFT_407572 [Lepidopterella palustris CBS 459.81]
MQDPDRDWKPSGRPQSTIARNFSAALDDLFKIDGGLDTLDRKVHQKKQSVSTHTQELEALEARLRETEERLKQAKSSPPFSRKNSQRRTPIRGTFAEEDKARSTEPTSPSPLAKVTSAPRRPTVHTESQNPSDQSTLAPMPGALPDTPRSYTSREYVMVDRPQNDQSHGDGEKMILQE